MTVGHTHHRHHTDRELTALCRFFATQREPPTNPPGDLVIVFLSTVTKPNTGAHTQQLTQHTPTTGR